MCNDVSIQTSSRPLSPSSYIDTSRSSINNDGINDSVTTPWVKNVGRALVKVQGKGLLTLYAFLVSAPTRALNLSVFILDSGATSHMTPHRNLTGTLTPVKGSVSLGDLSVRLMIHSRGLTQIPELGSFLYVPQLSLTLISLPVLDRLGYHTTIWNKRIIVSHNAATVLTGTLNINDGLYHLDNRYVNLLCGINNSGDDSDSDIVVTPIRVQRLWHL